MKLSFSYRCVAFLMLVLLALPSFSLEFKGLNVDNIQPIFPATPPTKAQAPLSPFTPPRLPSETQRRLQQWEALVADKAWDDAFHLIDALMITCDKEVFTLSKSDYARSIPLKSYLQSCLTKLSPEGVRQYRRLYDPAAEELYREGITAHDAQLLHQVTTDYFLTSWADDALLALGDMAFTSGDLRLARQNWQRINSLFVGPSGDPIDMALSNLKSEVDLVKLAKVWKRTPRPNQDYYYPDTNLAVSDVLSRLLLCSVQESDLSRAKAELLLLKALAPDSKIWIAGREQDAVAPFELLLSPTETKDDHTDRLGPLVDWQWAKPITLFPTNNLQAKNSLTLGNNAFRFLNRNLNTNSSRKLKAAPFVAGELILIQHAGLFTAWSAKNGAAVPGTLLGQKDIKLSNPLINNQTNNLRARIQGQILVNGRLVQGFNGPANVNTLRQANAFNINIPAPGTFASHEGIVYFCTPPVLKNRNGQLYTRPGPPTRLLGVDPRQEGKLVCEIDLKKDFPSTAQHFAGPPAINEDRIFLALNSKGAGNEFGIACYSPIDNQLLWKTNIGSGVSDPQVSGDIPLKITLGLNNIYLSTNSGAVISLNATNGKLRWISQYPRARKSSTSSKQPTGCLLFNDRLFVTPSDSEHALCIDAANGQILWSVIKTNPTSQIAIVTEKTVLLAGEQIEAIGRMSGLRKYLHPESKHSGIRGMGTGVAAGNEFFWPTRNEIHSIRIDDGSRSRPPISLSEIGHSGANLALYRDHIVVVGDHGMNVLGDQNLKKREPIHPLPHLSDSGLSKSRTNTISQISLD